MEPRVQVRWGDALQILPELKLPEGYKGIDLLLLDGVPKESLAYLRATEPLLSDGAVIVADNAGVVFLVFLYGSCSSVKRPSVVHHTSIHTYDVYATQPLTHA